MLKKLILFITLCTTAPYLVSKSGDNNVHQHHENIQETEQPGIDANDGLEPNLLNNILNEQNPDEIDIPRQKTTASMWKKIQIFWALPREEKKRILKEHFSTHKVAYGSTSTVALIALITFLALRKIPA